MRAYLGVHVCACAGVVCVHEWVALPGSTYAETLVYRHIRGLVCEKTSMRNRMLCSIQRGRMRSSKKEKCRSI